MFMASTINGYEGTGRSLSLKLIQQLREQSRGFVGQKKNEENANEDNQVSGRTLKEVKLEEPIRYAPNDPVEKWLNKLLCLDASVVSKNIQGCPHPSECELYYVNRDTLFSYHPVSETFLQRMMALYVASHYKNSPNDLQLMSDAPAHHLFVLLPPINENSNSLPDPLVVIQVCLEGDISRQTVMSQLSRGQRPAGDMIPWLISQQYQDDDFASLSGARVVRIAAHPDYANMGYGSRALELLTSFYQGEMSDLSEGNKDDEESSSFSRVDDDELENASLATDKIKVRDPRKMPPLLSKISDKAAPRLDYLGVSFGLTPSLHKFWKRAGFVPLYMRQTANDLTGEHTCVMLKTLSEGGDEGEQRVANAAWLDAFARDFSRRFLNLLAYQFREFSSVNGLSILESAKHGHDSNNDTESLTKSQLDLYFTPYDLKRLESYSNNMLDYHVIIDLVPTISELYFRGLLPKDTNLSGLQSAILLGIGLQKKTVDDLEKELTLASNQVMALFVKIIRKFSQAFTQIQSQAIVEEDEKEANDKKLKAAVTKDKKEDGKRALDDDMAWRPLKSDVDNDLQEAGDEVLDQLKAKQREMIDSLDLTKYAIAENDADWSAAEAQVKAGSSGKKQLSTVVSVKNDKSSKKRKLVESAKDMAQKEANRQIKGMKMSKKTRRS